MPYCSQKEVEFWGSVGSSDLGSYGYDYESNVAYLIGAADRAIDDYCDVPEGFFTAGGVEIQNEYLNGVDVGNYGLLLSWGLAVRKRPFLRLKYSPVLSVTKLEKCDSAGTWTTLTEGKQNDYLVMQEGVRFLRSVPSYDYKNVRVTYKVGYATTPGRVSECSARLAATVAQRIVDSRSRSDVAISGMSIGKPAEFVGLAKACFNDNLKGLVRRYRRKVPVKLL